MNAIKDNMIKETEGRNITSKLALVRKGDIIAE